MTAPHLGPGHTVAGKYTVRALLGFTGEVATYHAASGDGRDVVVKLYDPAIGQRADIMSQLEQVRAQLAALPSDLVVPVLDSGYDVGTSAPFTVFERLQIPSLSKLVETGPLSTEVVAAILRGLDRVLLAARGQRLHHHALKPTNIFVGPAPDYPVRVTDFGAVLVRSSSPTHETYAQSAPWWAPEQLQPAAVLGPATDVFTVALAAFYALTGRSYWMSCQTSPPDLPQWQMEVMGLRVPASQRARELGCNINAIGDGVFARALSVNQQDRPSSLTELASVLDAAGAFAPATPSESEATRTMAFPDGGGYPPSPVPLPAAGRGPATAAAPPALAHPASVQISPQAHAQAPAAGGYVATHQGSAVQAQDPYDGITPGLPPFPRPVKKKTSSAMLPVIIGVVAAALLGGGGVAFLFMRSGDDSSDTAATADGSAEPAGSAATGDGDAAGEDEDDDSADSAAADTAAAANAEVEVEIECVPKCVQLYVDQKQIKKPNEKFQLKPGTHTVRGIKAGYVIISDKIVVKPGELFKKKYSLVKITGTPPKKPCGQFLKPCK